METARADRLNEVAFGVPLFRRATSPAAAVTPVAVGRSRPALPAEAAHATKAPWFICQEGVSLVLPFLTPPRPRASADADATAAADEGGHRALPAIARDLAALGWWAAQRPGGRWVHAGGGDRNGGDDDNARVGGDAMVVTDDGADEASAPPPMPLERNASALLRAAAMAVAATVSCDGIVRNGSARFVVPVVLVLAQPPPPRLRRDTASAAADEAPRSPRRSPPQRSDPALRSQSPPTLCSRRRAAPAAAAVSRSWSHARPRSQFPNRRLPGCDVAWAVMSHGQCARAASRRRKTPLGVFLGA